jgi:hypothetical protein
MLRFESATDPQVWSKSSKMPESLWRPQPGAPLQPQNINFKYTLLQTEKKRSRRSGNNGGEAANETPCMPNDTDTKEGPPDPPQKGEGLEGPSREQVTQDPRIPPAGQTLPHEMR